MSKKAKTWAAGLLLFGVAGVWAPRFLPEAAAFLSIGADPDAEVDVVDGGPAGSWDPTAGSSAGSSAGGSPAPPDAEGSPDAERSADADDGGPTEDDPESAPEEETETEALLRLARYLRGEDGDPSGRTGASPEGPDQRPAAGEPQDSQPELGDLEIRCFLDGHALTATLVGDGEALAIVEGQLLRAGDLVAPSGARLVSIAPKAVQLELGGEVFVLEMAPFRVPARRAPAASAGETDDSFGGLGDEDPTIPDQAE